MDSPIVAKIRKLHTLAERGGTRQEAAVAAAMMFDLCRKHNINPGELFGSKWAKPPRYVMEMRIETERKVHEYKAWTQETEHIFGPCLACAIEIEYTARGFQWGKDWIEKQFVPETREILLQSLKAGKPHGKPSFSTLVNILCEPCQQEFAALRHEQLKELELKRERKQERREQEFRKRMQQEEWEQTWREPGPFEFERKEGRRVFFAAFENHVCEVLFRWRISNRCQCRGGNPGATVVMWVDGKAVAHYCGWDLTADERNEYYAGERQDRFGVGFRLWFERKLQPALLQAKPTVAWSVLDRRLMEEVDVSVGWLVHVAWHDGQQYAKVGPLPTLSDAVEFARKYLRMRITSSAPKPKAAHA